MCLWQCAIHTLVSIASRCSVFLKRTTWVQPLKCDRGGRGTQRVHIRDSTMINILANLLCRTKLQDFSCFCRNPPQHRSFQTIPQILLALHLKHTNFLSFYIKMQDAGQLVEFAGLQDINFKAKKQDGWQLWTMINNTCTIILPNPVWNRRDGSVSSRGYC